MSLKLASMLRIALAAIAAAALFTLGNGSVSHAGTSGWNTYTSGPASFQYPANWTGVTPDQGYLVGFASPDGAAEVELSSGPQHKVPTTIQELQSVLDNNAADPTDYPNFSVIEPPTNVVVLGASEAATTEFVFTPASGAAAGTMVHFFQRFAFRSDGSFYNLLVYAPDSQLSQYQDQVNQILRSLQVG